jgi:hypothetical protein
MATTFEFTITPDASLSIAPVTLTVSLDDPTDFQALLAAYGDILRVGHSRDESGNDVYVAPAPKDILAAFVGSLMEGTLANVASWVKQQKLSQVSVTTPTPTVTIS